MGSWGSIAVGIALASSSGLAGAQVAPGTVRSISKISHTQGGFTPVLRDSDQLGRSVTVLGDLDGNGVPDLASGGLGDDDGGVDQGAAHVLFLRSDGKVLRSQKISALAGNFAGDLDPGDQFGRDMAGIGDLDGDGTPDLAVGANYDDDGGIDRGALWILFLEPDGTVKRHSKISSTQGGFTGPLRNRDEFGRSVVSLGDLDGDGTLELAVGAPTDSTGGTKRGAVWILSLNSDGRVERQTKIAHQSGGFTGRLRNTDWFGFSLARLGDFDHDGVMDLAVGAALDDDGLVNAGAVWLLYLRPDGSVKEHRKISMLAGSFTGELESPDQFGTSVTAIGDLNGDGITELAVGAVKDDDGGTDRGSIYVLFLTPLGTVAFHQKISHLLGGFPNRQLGNWDWFGSSLAPLGDFNRDGIPDLVIGARNDDDGGPNRGALYLTMLNGVSGTNLVAAEAPHRRAAVEAIATEPTTRGAPVAPGPVVLGQGPEPVGSLELLTGVAAPGAELVFRLPVPAAFLGASPRVRLAASSRLVEDPASVERTGILIDPTVRIAMRSAVAGPSEAVLELSLRLPEALVGDPTRLAFQAMWQLGEQRELTDAVVLPIRSSGE